MSRGRPPKPDHLRQRRNKVPSAAQLPTQETALENEVPPLPARALREPTEPSGIATTEPWHPMVIEWWESVWRSPMASEYLDADMKGGLYLLAELHQARWTAANSKELVAVSSEIRLQEVRFGLSPVDRSRLRWTIEQGETAAERTESRRAGKKPPARRADPRDILKMVV